MRSLEEVKRSFQSIEPLGRGGQKVVYLAEHAQWGNVVFKLYFAPDDPRAEREISIGRDLDLANVPPIHEVGHLLHEGQRTLYLVEEFIDGDLMSDRIAEGRRFSLLEAVDFLEQGLGFICQLEDAHIVHRDIKPANIILGTDGRVIFLDFGIARVLNDISITGTEALQGPHSPGYSAPEQFNNLKDKIDSRADLFSLGVVTYEALTGENPFLVGARTQLEVLRNTETVTPVSRQIDGDSSQQFMALLGSLMGRYPSRRPRNAQEALRWLNAAKDTLDM